MLSSILKLTYESSFDRFFLDIFACNVFNLVCYIECLAQWNCYKHVSIP